MLLKITHKHAKVIFLSFFLMNLLFIPHVGKSHGPRGGEYACE